LNSKGYNIKNVYSIYKVYNIIGKQGGPNNRGRDKNANPLIPRGKYLFEIKTILGWEK